MSLLTELDAFWTPASTGPIVWIACGCEARMTRRVDDGDVFAFDG